jgi:tungstate transport system ATP-binding protein
MTDGPLYRLRGVTRRFGDAVVLDVPELDLGRGRIHFFAGPNGAGKTMMLGVLSLLESPDSGEVDFGGARVFPGPGPAAETLRKVTLVSQSPYLFDGTVIGNAAYGLRRRGMPRAEAEAAASEALALVGLEGFGARRARTLSGGEGKRLAIARALALRPEALLLDEPLADVDAENARIIEGLLREAGARSGTTVVATTHDLDAAYRLGARVLPLHGGRLVDAPPDNVYSGAVVERDGERRVRIAEGVEVCAAADRTGAVSVVVDARAVILSKAPLDSSVRNRLSGRVVSARLAGDHVRVTVDVGVPLVAWITPASLRELGLHPGDPVTASFKAASVRVL